MQIENLSRYLYDKLDEFVEKGVLENKKIVLFGLNTSSYGTKHYLEQKGYQIAAYVDNDKKKVEDNNDMIDILLPRHFAPEQYKRLEKEYIRAYFPAEYLQPFREDAVILIASKYYPEMCTQLEKMGYQEGVHILKTADFYDVEHVLNDGNWSEGLQEMTREQVRKTQLGILDHIKKVCDENGIRYFLGAGTLLGAIRHKGYIPWDDDIDINMPYPDYIKLMEILKDDEIYQPISVYQHQESYPYFFSRVEDTRTIMKNWEYPFLITSGVSVDLFPIFGLPYQQTDVMPFYDEIRKRNNQLIESYIVYADADENEIEKRKTLIDQIIEMMEKYPYDETENIGYILSKHAEKDIMKRDVYESALEASFEGETYKIMSGYDYYLTALYGDYMELPSEKEQRTTHSFQAYYKNQTGA
ncbi:MAG: LicD family protein [Butyribacter sp.]|nr:LicD family protein [bacterium]MDY3853701.1 LicD family protein [Butyribacter sp.]